MLINTSTTTTINTTEDEQEASKKFLLSDFNNNNFLNKNLKKLVTHFYSLFFTRINFHYKF